MEENIYIAFDRDYNSRACGYERLALHKILDFETAKKYIEKKIADIFEYFYDEEQQIDYPLLITNDKKLNLLYRNVLSFEEFKIYCLGNEEKKFFYQNAKPRIFKPIAFYPIFSPQSTGEEIFENFMRIIEKKELSGFGNSDNTFSFYDSSDGNHYESYIPKDENYWTFLTDFYFYENLKSEINE
jgi:hypothetical protein